jgi:hypothetical protein
MCFGRPERCRHESPLVRVAAARATLYSQTQTQTQTQAVNAFTEASLMEHRGLAVLLPSILGCYAK